MMESTADLIDQFIAMWNERNPQSREAIIAEVFTDGASYTDPNVAAE